MKRKSILFLLLALSFVARANHWQYTGPGTDNTMTVFGIIKIDGTIQQNEQLEIGAFYGEDCRGSQMLDFQNPSLPYPYMVFFTLYGIGGEELTFRLYDHENDTECSLNCLNTITYEENGVLGDLDNPYVFEFETIACHFIGTVNSNWSLADNWQDGLRPSTDDVAFVDANCLLDEDVEIKKLTVSNDKSLSVPSGNTLTAETLVTTSPAQLVIEDGGQLVHNNENVQATLQKNIIGYTGEKDRYYLIANPTANPAVANLNANEYDLFTFDPTHELEWVYQPEPAITQDEGYLYANSGDVTLGFAGVLIPAGEETIGLAYYNGTGSGREYPGVNLVGNPFACNAYISGNYYRMNNTEFIAATGEPIAPCEGIFVEATGVGQSITFTTTAPDMEANIEITLSQGRGGIIDRAILSFGNSYNLHKFMMDESNTQLYIPQDGEKFAAFTMENAIGEMPINFKAALNGTYTITVNVENASYLHLIDNLTGTDTDLLAISSKGLGSYTFTALTTDYASRFKLVFSMTGIGENVADTSFAYLSNGNLVVTDAGPGNTLQIIDALGRVVTNEKLGGNSAIDIQDLKAGVYVLRLINGEKIMVQKIVKD